MDKVVSDWAAGLPGKFLSCRDMGHVWHPFTARYVADERVYERTLRCSRCHTERIQELSMTGLVARSSYRYPVGYASPDGVGHLTGEDRGALRAESVVRYIEKQQRKAGNR